MTRMGYTLLLCALVCGCGKDLKFSLVQGTITQEGRPLAGTRVTFLPDFEAETSGPQSSGVTDADGHYKLYTNGGSEGVVQGKYRICLFDVVFASKKAKNVGEKKRNPVAPGDTSRSALVREEDPAAGSPRLPRIYERFDKTPLRAEVGSGAQTIDFDVPRP